MDCYEMKEEGTRLHYHREAGVLDELKLFVEQSEGGRIHE